MTGGETVIRGTAVTADALGPRQVTVRDGWIIAVDPLADTGLPTGGAQVIQLADDEVLLPGLCLLYTSPSPRDRS